MPAERTRNDAVVSGLAAGLPVSVMSNAVPGVGQGRAGHGSSVRLHTLIRARSATFPNRIRVMVGTSTGDSGLKRRLRFAYSQNRLSEIVVTCGGNKTLRRVTRAVRSVGEGVAPVRARTIDRELRTIEHELSTIDVRVPKIALRVRQIGKRGGATEVPTRRPARTTLQASFPA